MHNRKESGYSGFDKVNQSMHGKRHLHTDESTPPEVQVVQAKQ